MARRLTSLAVLSLALLLPPAASAETVVNGGFETGDLSGWKVSRATTAGNWFAYQGTAAPIGHRRGAAPVQPPPQGGHAAVADEANPDTLVLYQDLSLEPGSEYVLSLLAYYDSYAALTAPTPDSLSVDEEVLGSQANQQFRIDVLRAGAPLDSVNPEDILVSLFRTHSGGPRSMGPTRFTASLAPFAGQTVRLRIATAMTEEVLNAGVDDVSITEASAAGGGAGARLRVGKPRVNRKRGIVKLPVWTPASGRLVGTAPGGKLRKAILRANGPERLVLPLRPTRKGRSILLRKHKLRLKVRLRWDGDGGPSQVLAVPLTFKLNIS